MVYNARIAKLQYGRPGCTWLSRVKVGSLSRILGKTNDS